MFVSLSTILSEIGSWTSAEGKADWKGTAQDPGDLDSE